MAVSNIFLKEIEVDNFKSLKNSKITLQNGLNIIIGKNGAGKSNMLEFIYSHINRNYFLPRRSSRLLNASFQLAIEYQEDGETNLLTLGIERQKKIDASLLFPESNFIYEITVNKQIGSEKVIDNKRYIAGNIENNKSAQQNDNDIKYELTILRQLKKTYIKFEFPHDVYWLSKPIRFTYDVESGITFEESDFQSSLFKALEFKLALELDLFNNTKFKSQSHVNILKNKLLKYLKNFLLKENINDILKKYSPIKEIRFNPNINIYSNGELIIVENLSIDFFIEDDWMPWSYLSDGTKRLFYLLTEVNSSSNGIVLVEEPELGIHPHQLFKVLNFLQEESLTKQIIISTHSPAVLDILKSDELDRINIATYVKGTQFKKLTKSQIIKAKKYIEAVGELSYYWLHSDLEK